MRFLKTGSILPNLEAVLIPVQKRFYQEIFKNILKEYLADDSNFDKLLYKYLIKSGSVTGEQVCAIVYEQGVLPMDDSTYNGLLNGETNAFSWIKSKLESLELTPGELALEPCAAGAVVTNPNTGEVLACVSYPGYDNNRLSNVMDRPYYVQLSMGMSRTFYNRATQEKTAPGSTYKMLSSVASLTEGVINGTPISVVQVYLTRSHQVQNAGFIQVLMEV